MAVGHQVVVEPESDRASIRSLAPLNAAVLTAALSYGISFPLIAIGLERLGISGTLLGLNTAMPAIGWIIGAASLPSLQGRFGLKRVLLSALIIAGFALATFWIDRSYGTWTAARFLFGGSIGFFFRGVELWINQISLTEQRGRNLGINSACFLLGIAAGSALQPSLGTEGLLALMVMLVLMCGAGAVMSASARDPMPQQLTEQGSVGWASIFAVPSAFAAVLSYGFVEDVPAYFMGAYALRNGLSEDVAAYTLTAMSLGALLFAVPLGVLSDRIGRRPVLAACVVASIVIPGFVPASLTDTTLFLCLLLVWGGFVGSVYALAQSILGDRYSGRELVGATAAFGVVYGMGSLMGPLVNSAALERLETHGLMASASLIMLACGVVMVAERAFRGRSA